MYLNSPNIMRHKQQGLGLPATIFLISILALIVVAMSDLNEQSSIGTGQDYQSMRAFYAAESGAQIALNRVFVGGDISGVGEAATCNAPLASIDFDASGTNPGLNDCMAVLTCRVDTVDTIDYMTFTSTATCGTGYEQAQRSVEVRAK